MGRQAEVIRALAMRARAAKLKSDGAALGDESLKEEGRRRESAARSVLADARAARHAGGH
ncbi:hypothetical protein ACIBM4_15615 [Streptomyces sp. NPDC050256]|uniref:hypothetical protein n=1 Tax=Streptomyces sp. NPDC050256 TaxID=3365607 RepID=UPI0037989B87